MADLHNSDDGHNHSRRNFVQLVGAAGAFAGAVATGAQAQTTPHQPDLADPAAAQGQTETQAHMTARPQPFPPLTPDMTTSDILIETLIAWDVTHVFGIVGDGINPLTEALRKRQDRITFVTVRHEEAAAFIATNMTEYCRRKSVP